jgi:hypothetical protein
MTLRQLLQGKSFAGLSWYIIANIYSEALLRLRLAMSKPSCKTPCAIHIKLNKETGHHRGYPQTPPKRYATKYHLTTRAGHKREDENSSTM